MQRCVSEWATRHLGIPYIRLGRQKASGIDCLGLALIFYREVFGVELPDPIAMRIPWDQRIADFLSHFKRVAVNELQPGDGAYCRYNVHGKRINHISICAEAPHSWLQTTHEFGLRRIHIPEFPCPELPDVEFYRLRKNPQEFIQSEIPGTHAG